MTSATTWIDELKSVQGLTRLFADRGAQLLALLLLLALGVDSALILTRALGHGPDLPPPSLAGPPALVRPGVNPALQLGIIVNARLFGAAPVVAGGSDAPTTTMPLILAGVIADPDPGKGVAIIGENAAAGKLYGVGAAIPGGAHLHAVYSDRVLLERNGGLETLMLPRTPMAARSAAPSAIAGAGPRQGAARENASLLAGLVRVQPVFNQGKLAGYRIFPGGKAGTSAFTQLGLKSGDLIEAVNGTALDDAGRAMEVLNTLSSSATATVTVSRNGQPQEVNLNLANLNIETDSGDNSSSGPNAAGQAGAGPSGDQSPRGRLAGNPNLSIAPGAAPAASGTMNAAAAGAEAPAAPAGGSSGGNTSSERDR
ncbi:MAG: type II secretion system protein GspC [Steroidobacterales bacterium]